MIKDTRSAVDVNKKSTLVKALHSAVDAPKRSTPTKDPPSAVDVPKRSTRIKANPSVADVAVVVVEVAVEEVAARAGAVVKATTRISRSISAWSEEWRTRDINTVYYVRLFASAAS
jgi:hypothetical protein